MSHSPSASSRDLLPPVRFTMAEITDAVAFVAKAAQIGLGGKNTSTRALVAKCELALEVGRIEVER